MVPVPNKYLWYRQRPPLATWVARGRTNKHRARAISPTTAAATFHVFESHVFENLPLERRAESVVRE